MTLDQFRNLKINDTIKFRNNEYNVVSAIPGSVLIYNRQIGLMGLREDKIGRPPKEWGWELNELEKV